jgi:small subunit ribosomal protein S9
MAATATTTAKSSIRYFEGIGRRKTAVARVRIQKGKSSVTVNDRALEAFFPLERLRTTVVMPLTRTGFDGTFSVSAHVKGGGINAQAEAIRHGLARALVLFQSDLKTQLRTLGFLTRDARMVERKKYGLKKARRAPQWSKR